MTTQTWRPGFSFKNGKLYYFERRRITVIRTWPDPQTWFRTPTKPWKSSRKRADVAICTNPLNPWLLTWRNFMYRHYLEELNPSTTSEGGKTAFVPYSLTTEYHSWETKFTAQCLNEINKDTKQEFALAKFWNAIPLAERKIIETFNTRQWHMIALLARCSGATELSDQNPTLAWALASSWAFKNTPVENHLRSARALMNKKQRVILGWLDFPEQDLVCRLFLKIPPQILNVVTLLNLRRCFTSSQITKKLTHLPQISNSVLQALMNPATAYYANMTLLKDMAQEDIQNPDLFFNGVSSYFGLKETVELARRIDHKLTRTSLTSVKQLRELHDELAHYFHRNFEKQMQTIDENIEFNSPPFPGDENIIPLTKVKDILDEGSAMKHCIVSYINDILKNEMYVYRVINPVRATLAIVKNSSGQWLKREISGYKNEKVNASIKQKLFNELFTSCVMHS